MLLDKQTLFSDAQAVTATAASTDHYDLGVARDIGVGQDLYLVSICTVAMTDSGSDSTVTVTLETDDNASFSSATTLITLPVFAALAAAGTTRIVKLSPAAFERYIQARYTVANGNLTTGSFTTFLVSDIQKWAAYSSGYSVA